MAASLTIKVKITKNGNVIASRDVSVQVSSKSATESEISAAIKKLHPDWEFIIVEIKR